MGNWVKNPTAKDKEKWAAEAEIKRNRIQTMLRDGVAKIQSSDDFKAMLRWQGKFHKYSFSNMMLIYCQCPTATRVAGYKTWASLGRQPIAGKGINIIAPQRFQKRDKNGTPIEDEYGMSFKGVTVWDIADTNGPPIPEARSWSPTEGEDGTDLYEAMKSFIQAEGWTWETYDFVPGGPHGSANLAKRHIKVANGSPLTMLETAVHEAGHAFDEELKGSTTEVGEAVAQGVAFTVLAHFGLDGSESAFTYIARWLKQTDGATLIQLLGTRIQKISMKIIDGIEKYRQYEQNVIEVLEPEMELTAA